jgi:predicted DNA-binding protein (MmcQ/YjbR family)
MNVEWAQQFMLGLPHAVETVQWGANLVFWAGDKAVGGKMFALIDLDEGRLGGGGSLVISYAAGPERSTELLELEGVRPAPYLARAHWIGVERWDVFRRSEWERELHAAHAIVYEKLPQRTKAALSLPAGELKRLVAARRKLLAEKADSTTPRAPHRRDRGSSAGRPR